MSDLPRHGLAVIQANLALGHEVFEAEGIVNFGSPYRLLDPTNATAPQEFRRAWIVGLQDRYAFMDTLTNRAIELDDVVGPAARPLVERLHEAPSWEASTAGKKPTRRAPGDVVEAAQRRKHPMAKPNLFPALRYKNGAAAIEFLTRALGFEKQTVMAGPDGTVAHAQLSFGPGVIMLGSGKHEPPNPWDSVPQGVYVYVENVDAHYKRAKAAGAEIVMDLRDTNYGSREYSVRDPEGHLWSFGTYYPEPGKE